MAELLPRFYAFRQQVEDERRIAKIILEAGAAPTTKTAAGATAPGDGRRMRGIPIVGRSTAGGAILGTNPLAAVLEKERRGELHR